MNIKKILISLLCTSIIASSSICLTGCSSDDTSSSTPAVSLTAVPDNDGETFSSIGEGSTKFYLDIYDEDNNMREFQIHTDKTTIADALTELGLIGGEETDNGLDVKTVNGVTHDGDGVYWQFLSYGQFSQLSPDQTEIQDGYTYGFTPQEEPDRD